MADPARLIARVLPLALYVSARDVQQQLGVGRATAYEMLRAASGRGGADDAASGHALRVRLDVWQQYLEKRFPCPTTDCSDAAATGAPRAPRLELQRPRPAPRPRPDTARPPGDIARHVGQAGARRRTSAAALSSAGIESSSSTARDAAIIVSKMSALTASRMAAWTCNGPSEPSTRRML